MCGLVGVAGDVDLRQKRAFRSLLEVCQVRGRDSTGVVKVTNDKTYGFIKRVGPPSFLFDSKSYDDIIDSDGPCAALLGHCRHKTSGPVDNRSAHPFDFEDEGIIGMHNGTLNSYYNLDGYSSSKVDSEVLFEHLAKNGPEDTFPEISGAWACVWWDDNEKTLNFIRNSERPLWFTWSKNSRQLYWASETWMFGAIERPGETRYGIDLWEGDESKGKYIELPVDTLWSFEILTENRNNMNKPLFKMRPPRIIKGKPPVVRSHSGNVGRDYYGNQRSNGGTSSGSSGASSGNADAFSWKRDPKTGAFHKNRDGGGEVVNPFSGIPETELPLIPDFTQGDSTSSTSSAKESTTSSKNSSDQSKQSTNLQNSEQSTKSQRPTLSVVGAKTNKRKDSNDSTNSTIGFGVSHRTVAGIPYITNNKNSVEYSIEEFDKNTGSICTHCTEPIGDLNEVYEIFDKHTFLCKTCVTPTNIESKVA